MEITNLNYQINDKIIFKNCYLKIGIGLYYLKGPSGSGKSTFFNIVKGIIPLKKIKPFSCAYMNQDILLYENKTVLDNLVLVCQDKLKIIEYLNKFSLKNKLLSKVKDLSLGEKQRVYFLQTILRKTPVYLFDEGCSNLDSHNKELYYQELEKLAEKAVVIYSDHDNVRNDKVIKIENCQLIVEDFSIKKEESSNNKSYLNFFGLIKNNGLGIVFKILTLFIFIFIYSNLKTYLSSEVNTTIVISSVNQENCELYKENKQIINFFNVKNAEIVKINKVFKERYQVSKDDYLLIKYQDNEEKIIIQEVFEDGQTLPTLYYPLENITTEEIKMPLDTKKVFKQLRAIVFLILGFIFVSFYILLIEKNLKNYLIIHFLGNQKTLILYLISEFLIASLPAFFNLKKFFIFVIFNFLSSFIALSYIKKREKELVKDLC